MTATVESESASISRQQSRDAGEQPEDGRLREQLMELAGRLDEASAEKRQDGMIAASVALGDALGAANPQWRGRNWFRVPTEKLQAALKDLGFTVSPDGLYGPQTSGAVEAARRALKQSDMPEGPADKEGSAPGSTTERPPLQVQPVALSDRAISDVRQDALGFADYVQAVAQFLRARETEAPLAIAVHGNWGRGKTSFMNMLEAELASTPRSAGVRFATAWLNPWKFNSEPAQIWASFVATIVGCICDNLPWHGKLKFWFVRVAAALRRNFSWALPLHAAIAAALVVLVAELMFDGDSTEFGTAIKDEALLSFAYNRLTASHLGGQVTRIIVLLVIALYLYSSLAKIVGTSLFDRLRQISFKDKVNTLTEFEGEMRRLNATIPAGLKIVVFVDDLDRCRPRILWEVIEALQLLEVSRRCIFVLAMDMNIVSRAVSESRPDVMRSVMAEIDNPMGHGGGYRFLEKIIQARLSLPAYGIREIRQLIDRTFADKQKPAPSASAATTPAPPSPAPSTGAKKILASAAANVSSFLRQFIEPTVVADSEPIKDAIRSYGADYFDNPRRLKRFMNSFRLYAYLLPDHPPEQLARFLVLAEKWPALLQYLRDNPKQLEAWRAADTHDFAADPIGQHLRAALEGRQNGDDEFALINRILVGDPGARPFDIRELNRLAERYDFTYQGHNS